MKNKLFQLSAVVTVPDPAHWVDKYADHLYAFALNRLDDPELCRDLVQETFLAALEKLPEFRGQSSERTWLTAILKYKVIEAYRKRNSAWITRAQPHDPEPEYFEPANGHWKEAWAPRPMSIDAFDPALHKERATLLRRCLGRLPALWLTIFSMKHMDDAAGETICRQLKITPANYWVILHRAKLNLRACLQKEGL
jgi:RNA polymerase sigma-70 factor (ECF subfamily)